MASSSSAWSAASPPWEHWQGKEILKKESLSPQLLGKKGMVVVFLSAVCPCSNSHMQELAALAKDYPSFTFLGVHSNMNESEEATRAYFQQARLPFSVIRDKGQKIAEELKALKTPHAFVFNPQGEIVFQGGVSSSRNFGNADHKFLREALADIEHGRAVKMAKGRALGCVIERGGEYAW